ncbi:hypothetical protein OO013_17085 [Mangrovivirga sp. M17]|uniref:Uncharacterized protein n=1 Tax=Mangrovivirga halotolerans TaxID=2993936 RepID=A0ABT3RW68_9BACT|nr:hypothetical protein [Mangrovivirga halotolerans]MCX2745599.1 hypothetical protein [Mangrovivirga halotolerans]
MKRLQLSIILFFSVLFNSQAQSEDPLFATSFNTNGALLETQNLSGPKDLSASSIEFFTRKKENPVAYFPFGDISELDNDVFKMLKLFSNNIPFIYDPSKTSVYLVFEKQPTAAGNYVIKLAENPLSKIVDAESGFLYLPTKYQSFDDAKAGVLPQLQKHFSQDYYNTFLSFAEEQ